MWNQHVILFSLKIPFYQILVLVALSALGLGYILSGLISRFREQGVSAENSNGEKITSNKAFLKGLSFVLSDKREEAIEEFTRAVAEDTQTVGTYIALGNLYRSKGDFERAIGIRQSLIHGPRVDKQIRLQARYDLGLDYRMAGLFGRAVHTFEEVLAENPSHEDSLRQLIQIYEDTKEWESAFDISQKLCRLTGKEPQNTVAHYQVEMGKVHFQQGRLAKARECYSKAINLDPGCVDAYLHLGDLHLKDKNPDKAVATWRETVNVAPEMSFLVFGRLARVYNEFTNLEPVEDFLNECAAKERDPLARLALAQILLEVGDKKRALRELRRSLELDPGLLEAHRELGFILLNSNRDKETLSAYHDLLDHLTSPGADFLCEKCGFVSNELMWRCTQCQEWDTLRLHRRRPILLALGKSDVVDSSEAEELEGDWS